MPTTTSNYGLFKPLVNNATDQDLWGGYLNTDMDDIDGLIDTAINWIFSSKSASFSVTAPTAGSIVTGDSKTLFRCDTTGGAIIGSLPAAATCAGMTIAFKKTDVTVNTLTIQANGSEKIDSANTYVIPSQYGYLVIASDGTQWNIIAQTPPVAASTGRLLNIQTFTSTGTYTPTTGTNTIKAFVQGGGGGGGGSGGNGGGGAPSSIGTLCIAAGGGAGGGAGNYTPGAGGTVSGSSVLQALTGSDGGAGGHVSFGQGGNGGPGIFGTGSGYGGTSNSLATVNPAAGAANTGAGGGGAVNNGAEGGSGGGAGGLGIYYGPTTGTSSITIGAGGSAGSGSAPGANGGSGIVIIEEYS